MMATNQRKKSGRNRKHLEYGPGALGLPGALKAPDAPLTHASPNALYAPEEPDSFGGTEAPATPATPDVPKTINFNFGYFIAVYRHHKRFRLNALLHIKSLHQEISQYIYKIK